MYKGRFEGRTHAQAAPARRRAPRHGRLVTAAVAAALLLALAIGGTVAWLSTSDKPITNTFNPSYVACKVEENFDHEKGVKSKVNVKNTGDIDAFIRVKLVTYRTNDQGQHIGGIATLPQFALGENWVEHEGYYYYTLPVAPQAQPTAALAAEIKLTGSYEDADGGHQAIDVMAEAIQSVPAEAVGQAWGVKIEQNSVTAYTAGN